MSFADIASVYDGGKINFLQKWACAIDDAETTIYKLNNCLESNAGRAIAEDIVLNYMRARYIHENHVFIAVDSNGNVNCMQPLEFIIDAHCTSDCDKEFVRGYVQEALMQLLNKAIKESIVGDVNVAQEPELNVTIVNN